ncbi:MAG TPA: peptidoglycan editing factor PgeF [Candidatus Omnitrophota bacterium]|nr:peptidoglycan editing factor PgeF [Candidatus Omnitrophota bacterium]
MPKAIPTFSPPGLLYGFSNRQSGNMSLSYGDTANSLANRKKFLAGIGIDYRDLTCAKQVHGFCIRQVLEEDKGSGAKSYEDSIADTDGLITKVKRLPLAIFSADCLSIFLYDALAPAIGLVHAGWRSAKKNIVLKAIQLMGLKFNTQAEDLYVYFGPGIRSCCYEVGSEFRQVFPDSLQERGGHFYLDLAGINKKQLFSLGVKEDNLFDPCLCTSCKNRDFFSFRKEGSACGRMLSVIMLS